MPAERLVLPMPVERYHVMPHRLGWKHEYWNGAAQLVPAESAYAHFELDLNEYRAPFGISPSDVTVRPVGSTDQDALVALFMAAFDDGPDHCGWPDGDYRRDAERTADDARGFVASIDDRIVGALCLRERDGVPTIEPVMVDPAFHRRGVARALLPPAVAACRADGAAVLRSGGHLSNPASLAWHVANGFVEVPTWYATSARLKHHRWMAGHHESVGDVAAARRDAEEVVRLRVELKHLAPWMGL